jgi:hypothetical protein
MSSTATTTGEGAPRPVTARTALLGFAAGALSVLTVFQGTVWLLHALGVFPLGPFSVRPVPPFGVPLFVNHAFWGGLWGVLVAVLLRRPRVPDLLFGAAFGAVAVNLVLWIAVPAIKGTPFFMGGNPTLLAATVLLHAAFGWGVALILRWLRARAA